MSLIITTRVEPKEVSRAILYSSWEIVAALAGLISTIAIIRFFRDWKRSDAIDIIMCLVGTLLSFIAAVNAGSLDFVCTSGVQCINGVQTYSGQFFFFYLFDPLWLIMGGLFIASTVITLGNVFTRRSRGYSPE